MEEKKVDQMFSVLKEIQEKLHLVACRGPVADPAPGWIHGPVADPAPGWVHGPVADPAPSWQYRIPTAQVAQPVSFRGPVADPGPEIDWRRGMQYRYWQVLGPVADPGPQFMLDKERLAKLKIKQIDSAISGLENQINLLKTEQDLLKEEYNIK